MSPLRRRAQHQSATAAIPMGATHAFGDAGVRIVQWRKNLRGLVTDLDTEHGATDANMRDAARQVGQPNVAGLQL
jgi:hypothetical protein